MLNSHYIGNLFLPREKLIYFSQRRTSHTRARTAMEYRINRVVFMCFENISENLQKFEMILILFRLNKSAQNIMAQCKCGSLQTIQMILFTWKHPHPQQHPRQTNNNLTNQPGSANIKKPFKFKVFQQTINRLQWIDLTFSWFFFV